MIILTIRTDKPEAEIGLYDDEQQLAYEAWQAHRELSSTIHTKIRQLLKSQDKDWHNVEGLLFFIGPGSFTGLRIGATVANTTATALNIPIIGTNGDDWISNGIALLAKGMNVKVVYPFYGREPHITAPKK